MALDSAEAISKYLRSKSITTDELCDVCQDLEAGRYSVFFPSAHIFVLELIIDRWNDPKHESYRTNWRVWDLFNRMWQRVEQEDHKKRLSKRLRFSVVLLQGIESVKQDYDSFSKAVLETMQLINSTSAIHCSVETAMKLLGETVNLLNRCDGTDASGRRAMLNELLTLSNIESVADVGSKIATLYSGHLLSPTLTYMQLYGGPDSNDAGSNILRKLMSKFLYGPSVIPLRHIEKFLSDYELPKEQVQVFFRTTIQFLSSSDFATLESIFKILLKIAPEMSAAMLHDLSLEKKTMSQEFLENMFNEAFSQENWALVANVLILDVDVGIKNAQKILNVLSQGKINGHLINMWKALIDCHVIAREFPQFLEKWKSHCSQSSCKVLLENEQYYAVVAGNIPLLSVSQIRDLLEELLDQVSKDSSEEAINVATIIVLGLRKLPYNLLQEFKLSLLKFFELHHIRTTAFWDLKHHILELYDDVASAELLSGKDIPAMLVELETAPMNLYFTIFKIRELIEFEMDSVIENFIRRLEILSNQRYILLQLFSRWSTIVDLTFNQSQMEHLLEISLKPDNIEIYNEILKYDDFFEETNIIHTLVRLLGAKIEHATCRSLLCQFPVQCIGKNVRVDVINRILAQEQLHSDEPHLVEHLLKNPTFKSAIETDCKALAKVISQESDYYALDNPLFTTVWGNHLNNMKSEQCQTFISELIESISNGLTEQFEFATYKLAFYIVTSTPHKFDKVKEVAQTYVRNVMDILKQQQNILDNVKLSSWLMGSLYRVFCQFELSQPIDFLRSFLLSVSQQMKACNDHQLLETRFQLHCLCYEDNLEGLLACYVLLREIGVQKNRLLPAVSSAVKLKSVSDHTSFNRAFFSIISSFSELSVVQAEGVLELYGVFVPLLSKENTIGTRLFVRSVLEFHTYSERILAQKKALLKVLVLYKDTLVSKPWLFTQYAVESLFPLCTKLNISICHSDYPGQDEVFVSSTQLLSSVLLFHRYKLSNRHHLVTSTLCCYMGLLAESERYRLSVLSAKSFSRLVINFCEPSHSPNNSNKDSLNSRVTVAKRSLRKYLPIILLNYVNKVISHNFKETIRKEITPCIFSVFDVLSRSELAVITSSLDNPGRVYFKNLYAEYQKLGRWHEE
ncbi:AEL072Wp [Eremothecium gossypii ATCC 10895]|uniref:AEL072Wp n=1 Tax=Eremothecium gossypii (strain ATCC 10895 / CBS 109.51 / FGSC 9923 / NRRL Y-1056) TaxID=284811 RepID=Q757T4_EREGS|nr:AEL072Wp [Eremothecium gossypii ATCC 10895]AAS52613.1 AEL072Wp [Eremothecium gossypii ATCC 10895]